MDGIKLGKNHIVQTDTMLQKENTPGQELRIKSLKLVKYIKEFELQAQK